MTEPTEFVDTTVDEQLAQPVNTDNSPRPGDPPQPLQDADAHAGDADDSYDPDRDGIA